LEIIKRFKPSGPPDTWRGFCHRCCIVLKATAAEVRSGCSDNYTGTTVCPECGGFITMQLGYEGAMNDLVVINAFDKELRKLDARRLSEIGDR